MTRKEQSRKQLVDLLSKIDIDDQQKNALVDCVENLIQPAMPWWVIVLKTIAYIIGLVLAGYGTTTVAHVLLLHM